MIKVTTIASGDLWAGAEVMIYQLLGELRNYQDIELSALILNEKRLAEELHSLDIPVKALDEGSNSFPALLGQARAFLIAKNPDIIHSHRYKENILSFLAGGFGRRTGLIATQHGMAEIVGQRSIGAHLVARLNRYVLGHQFDRLVGVSKNIGSFFLKECKSIPENICTIHNGIEVPELQAPAIRNFPVAGSAGRFFPVKDYPLMVEIARYIKLEYPQGRFELAGDGPQCQKLEALISEYELQEEFCLRGEVKDMHHFYQGLDLYLNTSLHEGIPMSILEAMAHGLPVVAPMVGGLLEIITDGVEGFLIEGRDPESFARACVLLMRDQDLRKRMGCAARKRVERDFSAQIMAEKYYRLYRDLADQKSRARNVA